MTRLLIVDLGLFGLSELTPGGIGKTGFTLKICLLILSILYTKINRTNLYHSMDKHGVYNIDF
jgi:hypothetical protein